MQRISRQLKVAGVVVVALQEVANAEAARLAFPESDGWQVLTSAEVKGARPHHIAQHVGVAYQRHAGVKNVEVVDGLAVQGKDGRYTRPGLRFSVPIKGRDTMWLVVHLKAGCRSQLISEPGPARKYPDDRSEPADEYTARDQRLQADCWAFRQQVPVIEQWLDGQLRGGRQFVGIVGDFNRAILNELGKPARMTSQESAASPITSDTKVARLLPELSDGDPAGGTLDGGSPQLLWRVTTRGVWYTSWNARYRSFFCRPNLRACCKANPLCPLA